MNIYLVSRKENEWEYDTYIDFICYAKTPSEAIRLNPWDRYNLSENDRLYYEKYGEYKWPTDVRKLQVEYLGELPLDIFPATVISSDFKNS